MAEEGAFDEGADGVAFVGVELVDGFEVVAQVVGDGAFFWVEEERRSSVAIKRGEVRFGRR